MPGARSETLRALQNVPIWTVSWPHEPARQLWPSDNDDDDDDYGDDGDDDDDDDDADAGKGSGAGAAVAARWLLSNSCNQLHYRVRKLPSSSPHIIPT